MIVIPALAELAVGGYEIGGPSLWRDEGYTLDASQRPVGRILALLGHQDAVHGPYYVLMHFAIDFLGISTAALRLPSLLAMSLAAAVTAALGRRLARATALPAPSVTGLLAGLLLVAVPVTTWYAQDARPYALVSLCALIATYALVRAVAEHRWHWWACYTAAIVLTGLFNLFALLLLAAHAASLVIARMRTPGSDGPFRPRARRAGQAPVPLTEMPPVPLTGVPPVPLTGVRPARVPLAWWLVAASAGVAVLTPVIYLGYRQAGTLGWVSRPDLGAVISLVANFAGAGKLIPLVAALALCGVAVDLGFRRGHGLSLAVVALPWLVLPPLILLSVSLLHPVYVQRYVLFCLPALALLTASSLTWLAQRARMTSLGGRSRALAALPSAVLLAVLAAALVGPQQAIRLPSARPDNLRAVAAVVAAHERPGDAILYLPWRPTRPFVLAYPAPFLRLRDLALKESPVRSATLDGLPVSGAVLARRFVRVRRVWTVHTKHDLSWLGRGSLAREEAALLKHMRLIGRWRVKTVVLSLYVVTAPTARPS